MIRRSPLSFSTAATVGLRSARAFTIVELLVATAITLVVLGLMVQVTFSTLQTFDRVTGSLTSKGEAQRIFDYLRRDLSGLVWRRDENVWLLATVQPDQTSNGNRGDTDLADALWIPAGADKNPKPGNASPSTAGSSLRLQRKDPPANAAERWQDLVDYRFGQAGVWLRFFTRQNASSPEVTAVSYQIIRIKPQTNTTDREMRYLLFRSSVRPASTAATTRSVAGLGYDLADLRANSYNTPSAANAGDLEPGGLRRPDRESILGNHVVDFGIRLWRRDTVTGQGRLLFPARDAAALPDNEGLAYAATMRLPANITTAGGANTVPFGTNLNNNRLNTAGEENVGFPDYAEVMLRVLTEEGARTLAAYENGDIVAPTDTGAAPTAAERAAYWWTLAERHSVVYVDTIPLPARPL